MATRTKAGSRHILIVEDEPLIAMHLEGMISDLGHEVAFLATRMNSALSHAKEDDIDFAVLDVNVAGSPSFPVADILRRRGVPFIFTTGYGVEGLIDGYRDEIVVKKPFDAREFERAMALAISAGPSGPH
ncbi:response regulator [Inquilinus sp. CAU 1745]|uniref:response regulator n=1 Tax=Inquilinus sp. CAU 1745 TaxID=3140369 RepID=UPI00325B89C2